MRRIVSLLLVLVMVTSMLAGCGGSDNDTTTTTQSKGGETPTTTKKTTTNTDEPVKQILKWNIGADPKTIDPSLNGASDGGDVIAQTFEGLVREREGNVVPGIATEWSFSDDKLTLTFKLRKSNWSDGSPLTAHDFVWGWKRCMDPDTASEYAWIWEYTNIVGAQELAEALPPAELNEEDQKDAQKVAEYEKALAEYPEKLAAAREGINEGIEALDDYTLQIKLKAPTGWIVSLLSFYHFMPIKASAVEGTEEGAWAKDPDKTVCNGAFKLAEYTIGKGLKLVKNPEYWNADEVILEAIEGQFIDQASTAYQAYLADELHAIPSVPLPEIPRLAAESPELHIFPLLGTYYYNFNLTLDIWKDVRVRKALNYAIDRQQICDTMSSGQVPAQGFVPPGFKDHEGKDFFEVAGTYGMPSDGSKVEEAKQLLADAGYPNGEGFPEFTILYNTSEGHKAVAEMVQEMLKTNLGINTKLQNQEWAVFQDTRKEGQYDLARGGWLTDYMDPSGMLSIFTSENAYNDPKFKNAEFDKLLSESSQTIGKDHFEKLYKAQDILMNELPVIPVYHYTNMIMTKSNLKGWHRSVLGSFEFTKAYFE